MVQSVYAMPGTTAELPAYFDVDRQIVSTGEARRFLNKLGFYAMKYLGTEISGSVAQSTLSESADGDVLEQLALTTIHSPVSSMRLEIYPVSQLRTILFHRSVPRSLASRYSFSYAAALFKNSKFTRPIDNISAQRGQNPERTPILCSALSVIESPGIGKELVLTPEPNHIGSLILQQQVAASEELLTKKCRTIFRAAGNEGPYVPLARLPDDIHEHQLDRLLVHVSESLPERFEMGKIWST
ncbi:MAG: hypothetical protein NVS1B7_8230 [Candidatus Saccharimonadales bacterium]